MGIKYVTPVVHLGGINLKIVNIPINDLFIN